MQQWQSQEAFNQFNDINRLTNNISKRKQELLQEFINDCVVANSKQMESWTKLRRPEQYFELQAQLLNETREFLADTSRKWTNSTLEDFADISKLFESSLNIFNPANYQASAKSTTTSHETSSTKK